MAGLVRGASIAIAIPIAIAIEDTLRQSASISAICGFPLGGRADPASSGWVAIPNSKICVHLHDLQFLISGIENRPRKSGAGGLKFKTKN
jgi:hypothetical protein